MNSKLDIKGIIFDFDGTLADTLPLCIKAFQQALYDVTGVLYKENEITKHFGKSEEGIIQNIVPDKFQECLAAYYKTFEKLHYICPNLFNGVVDILEYLKLKGYKLAIVTGRGKGVTDISLKYYGLDKYFEYVETGSIKGSVKAECIEKILSDWNIKPDKAIYIGDTINDITDSKKAGVIPISAAWAPGTNKDILLEKNPDFTFSRIEDFKNWLINF